MRVDVDQKSSIIMSLLYYKLNLSTESSIKEFSTLNDIARAAQEWKKTKEHTHQQASVYAYLKPKEVDKNSRSET